MLAVLTGSRRRLPKLEGRRPKSDVLGVAKQKALPEFSEHMENSGVAKHVVSVAPQCLLLL